MIELELIAIKTEKGYYISDNYFKSNYYDSTKVFFYLFDGKKLEETYNKNWGYTKSLPKKVEKEINQPDINHRYELIDPELTSKKCPKVLIREEVAEYYDYGWNWKEEYKHLQSLYKLVSDKQPNKIENIEFDITVIAEIENFQFKKGFKFEALQEMGYKDIKINITEKNLQYQLLDKIIFHPDLLQDKKCRLSSEDSYKIIRNYIKQNINLDYAKIDPDYRFCFGVKKKIKLADQESYTIDVNLNPFGKKRKPRYETRYRKSREVTIYEIAPKPYQHYPTSPSFEGENWEDIEQKIKKYLEDLINKINEPLIDCKYCKGMGVVLNQQVKHEPIANTKAH